MNAEKDNVYRRKLKTAATETIWTFNLLISKQWRILCLQRVTGIVVVFQLFDVFESVATPYGATVHNDQPQSRFGPKLGTTDFQSGGLLLILD